MTVPQRTIVSNFFNNKLAITSLNASEIANAVIGTHDTVRNFSTLDFWGGNGDFVRTPVTNNGINTVTYKTTSFSHTHRDTGITETFSDFTLKVIENPNDDSETWDINGTFGNSKLNGAVSFETLHSFVKTGKFPYEGTLNITGMNNSSVKVIALDEVTVRLEVDEDGDGAIDNPIEVAWASLRKTPENSVSP